jgi:molybdopterin converting factor small subunit
VKVRIPTPLYAYTKNLSVVDAEGATLDELTRDLDRRYPGLRFRIVDEQGRIRPHIKIFVNAEQADDLSAGVTQKDDVMIVQSFSGG